MFLCSELEPRLVVWKRWHPKTNGRPKNWLLTRKRSSTLRNHSWVAYSGKTYIFIVSTLNFNTTQRLHWTKYSSMCVLQRLPEVFLLALRCCQNPRYLFRAKVLFAEIRIYTPMTLVTKWYLYLENLVLRSIGGASKLGVVAQTFWEINWMVASERCRHLYKFVC